jgi:hypothetical protein
MVECADCTLVVGDAWSMRVCARWSEVSLDEGAMRSGTSDERNRFIGASLLRIDYK